MNILGDEHITVSLSASRDNKGEISFDVYCKDTIKRYPISFFFDWKDQSVSHDHVTQCINDWIDIAKKFPKNHRNCIWCNCKAKNGKIMCNTHEKIWGDVVYTEDIVEAD
jgi:hypothetical protein